ncbi:MAG: hypothetical protein NZ903_01910 [Candidatus Micrarchaeota archaeon]|nr:hypothetical protein [Candidatus Micrarchaeota archaeon]
MGKWTKKWAEKSEKILGKYRGEGIFMKMMIEKDRKQKIWIRKRKPKGDNRQNEDDYDRL